MKLYIKQKVFAMKDRFTVVNENSEVVYSVEGKVFSIGKKLRIYDHNNQEVAYIEQRLLSFVPTYYIIIPNKPEVTIKKKISFMKPKYIISGTDWLLQGNYTAHEYQLVSGNSPVMSLTKKWFTWGDSYELTIEHDEDALLSLCITLVVDACIEQQRNASSNSAA